MEGLTEKQRKLVKMSEDDEIQNEIAKRVAIVLEQERERRKKVFDTIVLLSDVVSEDVLLSSLSSLDTNSWLEVIEERFITHICGYPICSNRVQPKKVQKYHIDKKSRKIFETSAEKVKFCSEGCYNASIAVRIQLNPHPLWQTGEENRQKAFTLGEYVPQPVASTNVEIVQGEEIIAKMSELKLAERDADSSGEDEEDEIDIEGNKISRPKRTKDDDEFINSIKRFVSESQPQRAHMVKDEKAQSPKPEKMSVTRGEKMPVNKSTSNIKFNQEEAEKLARIREKYSRKNILKAPVVINSSPLPIGSLKEAKAADKINIKHEVGDDGVVLHLEKERNALEEHNQTKDDNMREITRIVTSWINDNTRELIYHGGRHQTSETQRLMFQYLAGERGIDELDDVTLPDVDCIQTAQKRINILIGSIKASWNDMERRLSVSPSQSSSLLLLISSFNLTSDNITGFSRSQLRVIVIVLYRMICYMDVSLGDKFLSDTQPDDLILQYLSYANISSSQYSSLCHEVLSRLQ